MGHDKFGKGDICHGQDALMQNKIRVSSVAKGFTRSWIPDSLGPA